MQDLYQSLPWRQLVSTPVLVHCTNPVALGTVLRQRIQWLELKGRHFDSFGIALPVYPGGWELILIAQQS